MNRCIFISAGASKLIRWSGTSQSLACSGRFCAAVECIIDGQLSSSSLSDGTWIKSETLRMLLLLIPFSKGFTVF